jgi:hypothetical protein
VSLYEILVGRKALKGKASADRIHCKLFRYNYKRKKKLDIVGIYATAKSPTINSILQ